MTKGKIIIISGPSGSGKTTLYKRLLASKKFSSRLTKTVSVTTRLKRPGEKHGRDYFFVSPKMFLYKKQKGHFLESENVFGNYYGTPLKQIRDLLKRGKNVLLCIDVKGAKTVLKKFPAAVTIFIKAPSLKILEHRLMARGSESQDVLRLRLKTARQELREARNYGHTIINDNLRSAYRLLRLILSKEIE